MPIIFGWLASMTARVRAFILPARLRITISDPVVEILEDPETDPRDFDCYSPEEIADFDNAARWFVGIRVAVRVYVWYGGSATVHPIHSAGLWGIDTDGSVTDYFRDGVAEEADSLIPLLERLAPEGFDPVAFVQAARAEPHIER